MANQKQFEQVRSGKGFIAALDQSGGSTPKALKAYGISESAYSNEEQMFTLVHQMRERIITSPAFNGDKIIGAILFEKTMNDQIKGKETANYLWEDLQIVPFLKIDKGLAAEKDGVQLMKDMPSLASLLDRAVEAGIFGTKMRSFIRIASTTGIRDVVAQQFDIANDILNKDLVPIIEPEVSILAENKEGCEEILLVCLLDKLNELSADDKVMLKLTLPDKNNFYHPLVNHDKVVRVVALSGGYDLEKACQVLSHNEGIIASFSRALSNDLHASQSDEEFNRTLASAIEKIYQASVKKEKDAQAA